MNSRTEGATAILAALLVLFGAMWDARISAVAAAVALVALGIYRLVVRHE